MSRLWRDQLQVFIAPDQVIVAGQSRGFKPLPLFRQHAICSQTAESDMKSLPWELPLDTLEQLVVSLTSQVKPGSELQVTLADDFVRYGLIAPQPTLANPDELMAYASFQMREIYGERVEEWALSIGGWDPIQGGLCAAIPLGLLAALEQFATRHELKLTSTEPYLTAAIDYWSDKLLNVPLNSQWFVLIEANRFCLVSMLAGKWQCIRNQRVVNNLEQELLSALEQEAVLSGRMPNVAASQAVQVFAPATAEWQLSQVPGWRFERLLQLEHPLPAHFPFVVAVPPENQVRVHA